MPSYEQLADRDWLKKEYLEKNRPQSDIADEIGCTQTAVSHRVREYGFKKSEYQYPELDDREWLKTKHHEENLGLSEMSDIIGCTRSAVGYACRRNGVETRRNTLVNQIDEPLSKRARQIIEGELLGDGCIPKPRAGAGAQFSYGTSRKGYRDWLSSWFNKQGIKTNEHEYVQDIDRDGWSESKTYRFNTGVYFCLMDSRKRWYPDGKKRVPDDFQLSPLSARHWYIGDGSYSPGNVGITLYTDGFPAPDVRCLIDQLSGLGVDARMSHRRSIIIGRKAERERFFEYMEPLPGELHDVYGYKWPEEYR